MNRLRFAMSIAPYVITLAACNQQPNATTTIETQASTSATVDLTADATSTGGIGAAQITQSPTTALSGATATEVRCDKGHIVFTLGASLTPSSRDGLYRVCSDGSGLHQIISNLNVGSAISRDGKYAAFADDDGTIAIVTTRGDRVRNLHVNSEGDRLLGVLSWSPHGDYISYLKTNNSIDQLDIVHIETETISRDVVPDNYYEQFQEANLRPAWSPIDNRIAWSVAGSLYTADIDCDKATHRCHGTTIDRIVISPRKLGTGRLSWSPDGTKIAASCYLPPDENFALCIFDTDGHLLQEFTEESLGVERIRDPDWSPDGTRIVFSASNENDFLGIFVLSLADGDLVNLTKGDSSADEFPVWIP